MSGHRFWNREGVERVDDRRVLSPPVDIYENKEHLLIFADLPGVKEDQLKVRFENNQLSIEGAYSFQHPVSGEKTDFVYSRAFVLPDSVDPEAISARLSDGVLRIELPRHERVKPRQIPVTVA